MSNNSATSCLGAEPHNDSIKDPLVHYFGCIQFCGRGEFLESTHQIWIDEEKHQRKLEAARNAPRTEIDGKAKENANAIRERRRNSFNKELRRVELLRETLERDESDNHLVQEVNECRKLWRSSPKYKKHLDDMRRPLAEIDATAGSPDSDPDDYIPEKDVSVGIIQFKEGQPFNENCDKGGLIWGKFPDQKTCVQSLLREGKSNNPDENVLHKGRISIDPSRVRYFHIPSNIMTWAEEAISRYFGEERPDFASFQRQLRREEKSRSSIILQDRYWHGQLHADERGSLHARYMSPICETVSYVPGNTDLVPNNLVLFMPYLHWETSRKREYFALEMERIMAADSERKEKDEEDKRSERIRQLRRTDTENEPKSQQNPTRWATAYNRAKTGLRTLRTMTFTKTKGLGICAQDDASSIERSIHQVALVVMKKPPFKIQAPLAKYLMAVSKLHEGMANYRDKMLLRKYLPGNPPLHPRRTLDQAFYWTLRTTKERDCDQVVFRGTTAKPDEFHRFDYEKKKWPKHEEFKIEGNCTECKLNIQKLSRVIMVDQLWMWILDANTIITCFPKRYGANKNDALGIHKSIRSRVEESGPVHTVFELGLIIIDECSKTFFDRTKTLDRRPQAIDEFSIAIGNIMHKQTVAFKRLWWWTEQAKSVYCSTGYINTSNFHMSLLDINPEGHLEREIEDIVEELDIMLHISNTHNDILRRFVEQAERILDPKDEFKGSHRSQQRRKSETDSSLSESEKEERRQREKVYRCFKQRAEEGQARAMDHIAELKKLRESAKKTADDVLHLLFMKQQQASVFQAWQAMKQSDETIKQGRSIMTFTLVTIVFLPLSFLSSVFGMNNKEFGDNTWSISQQILYIFSISAGVVFLSLLFAFSHWIRAFIWSICTRSSTSVVVGSGLYDFYLRRPTERIYEDAETSIQRVKTDRRRNYFKRKGERRLEMEQQERERAKAKEEQEPRKRMIPRFGAWGDQGGSWAYWSQSHREGGDMPLDNPGNGLLPK